MNSLRQLEQRWLSGNALSADELPPAESLTPPLQQRADRLRDWIARSLNPAAVDAEVANHTIRLHDLCIAIEFLAGVDTPPEFAKERMDYQVNRLAGRMGGEKTQSPRREAAELERQWLSLGPTDTGEDDALNARFAAALKTLEESLN